MSESEKPDRIQPDLSQRQLLPDLIRCWAILGIVLINVGAFSWPVEMGYSEAPDALLDNTIEFLAVTFFMTKAYGLFSLMFGVGLAYQIISAKRQGKSPIHRHFRRMAGLFALGLAHAVFFYIGDVLILYASVGCLLYAFRTLKPGTLAKIGISLLVFQAILYLAVAGMLAYVEATPSAPETAGLVADMIERNTAALAAFGDGTFAQATQYRAAQLGQVIGAIAFQGFSVLGYFLLGLALAKKGLINTPGASFWKKCRWRAFPIGLLGSAFAAYMHTKAPTPYSAAGMASISGLTFFGGFLAFGYAGWIAKYAAGPASKLRSFLARAGTATLTAYLLQSVILSFIFSAYGLDMFARLGAASSIAIAFLVGVFTIVTVSVWRMRFARGPMEMLLRRWTYIQ